jgi:hypothetical protein
VLELLLGPEVEAAIHERELLEARGWTSLLCCTMSSRSRVQAVMLDIRNDEGDCTPTKVEVNSWVSLMPGKRGGHAKDVRKHGGSSVHGSYKAQVLGFRFNANSTVVTKIRVRHAYMQRQLLDLRKEPGVISGGANCKHLPYIESHDSRQST